MLANLPFLLSFLISSSERDFSFLSVCNSAGFLFQRLRGVDELSPTQRKYFPAAFVFSKYFKRTIELLLRFSIAHLSWDEAASLKSSLISPSSISNSPTIAVPLLAFRKVGQSNFLKTFSQSSPFKRVLEISEVNLVSFATLNGTLGSRSNPIDLKRADLPESLIPIKVLGWSFSKSIATP